jgi:hypothetical protein
VSKAGGTWQWKTRRFPNRIRTVEKTKPSEGTGVDGAG